MCKAEKTTILRFIKSSYLTTPLESHGYNCNQGRHAFAFSVSTSSRTVDIVAPSEQVYKLWVDGLQCVLLYRDYLVQPPAEE